jgi:hypothetical protein
MHQFCFSQEECGGACMCDGVLFVERAGELPSLVRLSQLLGGAKAKASPKGRGYVTIYGSYRIGGGRPETV